MTFAACIKISLDLPRPVIEQLAVFRDFLIHCRTTIERLALFRPPINETEAQVAPVTQGIPWLGFVTYPDQRRMKRRNWVGFAHRMRGMLADDARGRISFAELDAGVQGWVAHAAFGNTWRLRASLFDAPWSARIDPRSAFPP